jgi:hypothetical protein
VAWFVALEAEQWGIMQSACSDAVRAKVESARARAVAKACHVAGSAGEPELLRAKILEVQRESNRLSLAAKKLREAAGRQAMAVQKAVDVYSETLAKLADAEASLHKHDTEAKEAYEALAGEQAKTIAHADVGVVLQKLLEKFCNEFGKQLPEGHLSFGKELFGRLQADFTGLANEVAPPAQEKPAALAGSAGLAGSRAGEPSAESQGLGEGFGPTPLGPDVEMGECEEDPGLDEIFAKLDHAMAAHGGADDDAGGVTERGPASAKDRERIRAATAALKRDISGVRQAQLKAKRG